MFYTCQVSIFIRNVANVGYGNLIVKANYFEKITPDWRPEKLFVKSAIQQGMITNNEVSSKTFIQVFMANITKLKINYTSDAAGLLPKKLLLKSTKTELHPEITNRSSHEASFYEAIDDLAVDMPVPLPIRVAYSDY